MNILGGYIYPDGNQIRKGYAGKMPDSQKAAEPKFPWNATYSYQHFRYTCTGTEATILLMQNLPPMTSEDTILLPEYLCDTVIKGCGSSGASLRYYSIKDDFSIDIKDIEKKLDDSVVLIYVIHYFGIAQPLRIMEMLKDLQKKRKISILEDVTQAAYSVAPGRIGVGKYLVGGFRKWWPIPDGGFVCIKEEKWRYSKEPAHRKEEIIADQLLLALWREDLRLGDQDEIERFLVRQLKVNQRRYTDIIPRTMSELSNSILFQLNQKKN